MFKKVAATAAALTVAALLSTGCSSPATYDNPVNERSKKQNEVTLDNSLGIDAQKERLSREDDVNAVRYVYLINYGQVFGYYVIKGGVYGADTQLAPEQEVACPWNRVDACNTVDSMKDNGTYGGSDAGVFFITAENVLVETTLDYIQADAPIAVYANVPELNSNK